MPMYRHICLLLVLLLCSCRLFVVVYVVHAVSCFTVYSYLLLLCLFVGLGGGVELGEVGAREGGGGGLGVLPAPASSRGWLNTVEVVLLEISNSMKPYPSVFHAYTASYTSKMKPVIGFLGEPTYLDEVSNRIPPTSHSWVPSLMGA